MPASTPSGLAPAPTPARGAALVTGGAVRLGRALALSLAEAGFDIALHYGRSADAAEETQGAIRALGRRCVVLQQDLAETAGLEGLVVRAREALPTLSVLVNSASVYEGGGFSDLTPEVFDAQMAVNLKAPIFLMQAFARHVDDGQVINILDNKIAFNQFAYGAYLLSKKGLAEATRMAAMEYAPRLRVNGVAPGVVMPASDRSAEYVEWRRKGIPLQRTGEAAHIAAAVLSLVDNPFMTGQVLTVDGGETTAHLGRNYVAYGTDD